METLDARLGWRLGAKVAKLEATGRRYRRKARRIRNSDVRGQLGRPGTPAG